MWFLDGILVQNGINNYFITQQNGNYSVEVSNAQNCSILSTTYLYQGLNVNEITSEITVYPNPSSGNITINGLTNKSLVKIFDTKGALLLQSNAIQNNAVIDLQEFENGVYFLHIFTNEVSFVQKIMLNK